MLPDNFGRTRLLLFLMTALIVLNLSVSQSALVDQDSASAWPVMQLTIEGAVGPATSDYVQRNIDAATESGFKMILIRIDTPGGLDSSMREIIKKIVASPLPVIGYVAPSGARAASAGTYILYACHIAAMAPATNLGAATPVQVIDFGKLPVPESKMKDKNTDNTKNVPGQDMAHKMINDAVAYIRGLATMRGRNADWAESAVRQAASLQAKEALKLHVIDLMAANNSDLMEQLNGRTIKVLGQNIVLKTRQTKIDVVNPDWRSQLLSVISNPNIAYILLLLGLYGIAVEFTHPGAVAPGTVGVISLLLALYAFQLLPVNYTGFALIVVGLGLMVAEAFAPSFGILGIGGLIAFIFGSVVLFDVNAPGFELNRGLIGGFALSSVIFLILALGLLLKSRSRPVVTGKEELLGAIGIALEDFTDTGRVRIHSETWRAYSVRPVHRYDKVKITGIDGLILSIIPCQSEEKR